MPTADVAVIGAGATGCAVAAHLLRLVPGLGVALLERVHVGAGSTSRSTAAFRHQWSVPAHVAFSRYSAEEYDRLTGDGFPIQFRRQGYLFLFSDARALARARERVERQRRLGVKGVAVLTPGELAEGLVCGRAIQDDSLVGATWGPEDGFLDPLAVAQAYLNEARDRGICYFPDTEVVGIRVGRGRVHGVDMGSGETLSTEVVINSAGVWSGSVAGLVGLDLPLRPAKRYLYHTHPVRNLDVSGWPLVIAVGGAHCRPSEGNTLMMAWEHRPDVLSEYPDATPLWSTQDVIDPGFGIGPDGYGVEVLLQLARHMPVLADAVGLASVTCGWYAVTPDHKAILGPDPRLSGLFHASGFSGHGIMHAAASGLTLAEMSLGRDTSLAPRSEIDRHFGLEPLLEGRLREPVEDMVL